VLFNILGMNLLVKQTATWTYQMCKYTFSWERMNYDRAVPRLVLMIPQL